VEVNEGGCRDGAAEAMPLEDGVAVATMIVVKGLPWALVPVEVKENGCREGPAEAAPLEDGVAVATMIDVKGLP